MSVSREYLARCAAASGYAESSLEKVIRLGELAGDVARHGLLGGCLALKGGTALQICFGPPSRLSVDLDFNYVGGASREQMLADRPSVEEALLGLAARRGYAISRSRREHAGGKIFLGYRSALATPDRIEVDLNYLFRTPLEPVEARTMWQPGELDRPQVRTVGLTELLVGKMVALLARSAPRDLWDIVNLPAEALNRLRTPVYRSWFVGIASVLNHPLSTYKVDSIGRRLTQSDIEEQLGPMLTRGKTPRVEELVAAVRSIMSPLLKLSPPERAFAEAIAVGDAPVDMLFPNDPRASHLLEKHPALAWKLENVRRHRGLTS
jgi:predicted nucleotidyltransferase component of viral defense system